MQKKSFLDCFAKPPHICMGGFLRKPLHLFWQRNEDDGAPGGQQGIERAKRGVGDFETHKNEQIKNTVGRSVFWN
jgi:hypothetical protein